MTYSNDPKNNVNKYFSIASILLVIWLVSNQLSNTLSEYHTVLWLNKIIFSSTSLFVLFLVYFSILFPKGKTLTLKAKLAYGLPALLVSVLSLTDLIVKDIIIKPDQSEVVFGKLNIIYSIQLISYVIISFVMLIRNFLLSKGETRIQIRLLFSGFVSFIVLVLITNLALPQLFNNFSLTTYGSYTVILLLGFTAYAILKHHLLNIRIVLTESVTFLVAVVLIIQIILSGSRTITIMNSIVILFVIYGGYLIAKSVKNETERREQVELLAAKLDEANKHLEELDEAKDNFLSMAAHELNTPIAAIEGYLSMIIDEKMAGELNEKLTGYLKNIYGSSKRLANLVKNLLNVSRIESNRIHLLYSEVQTEDIIDQAITEIKIKADEVGHKLIFEKPSPALPKTWFDVDRITEVLINMIGNAIKYTDPPGKITVSTHTDGDKIVVAIKDNGRGIPEEKDGHIFEKFSQVNVMKDQVKGTGLGMFIVKNLIELHKGKVWYKSSVDEKDHGTTFYFSLPILKEKPEDPHEGEGALFQTRQPKQELPAHSLKSPAAMVDIKKSAANGNGDKKLHDQKAVEQLVEVKKDSDKDETIDSETTKAK